MVELARHNKPNAVAISLPMHNVLGTGHYGSRANNHSFGRARGASSEKYIGRTLWKAKPLQGFLHPHSLFGRGGGRQKHGHSPCNMHGKVANQEVGIATCPKHHAFSLHALVVLGAQHRALAKFSIGKFFAIQHHRHPFGGVLRVPFYVLFNAKHRHFAFV